jgi:DNA (cytosine-5)-methyltransferase 1
MVRPNGTQTTAHSMYELSRGTPPQFADVFAGAGGLSLGLLQAGWKGLFAVEQSPMAFETLKFNLIDPPGAPKFHWPPWLPIEAIDIETFCKRHEDDLKELKGLPLLAGGPPCQGYSHSGRRDPNDERNQLVDYYLELVRLLEPKLLLIENVTGFASSFEQGGDQQGKAYNADHELRHELDDMGYKTFVRYNLMAKDFGVPQLRPRYILIAILKSFLKHLPELDPFQGLDNLRPKFLLNHGLSVDKEVTLQEAVSDLLKAHGYKTCKETGMKRFSQGVYGPIESSYQKLLRKNRDGELIQTDQVADSHRFPNHKPDTVERFRGIIENYRPGIQLNEKELELLGLNKHRIAPLAADEACHTLTSLPDDLVHYSEPRIPTVREYARIQSFPDWFEFKSNYTSGGERRKVEVPRYTQVANAVPPLLAEAIGKALHQVYFDLLNASPATTENIQEACRGVLAPETTSN